MAANPARVLLASVGGVLVAACVSGIAAGNEISHWPVEDGGNGHYYEVVSVPDGIQWDGANARATGRGGYLATITSQAENLFVFSLVSGNSGYWQARDGYVYGPWLGGMQITGSPEPSGGWRWVTEESFEYTVWGRGEPNNNGKEDRLHYGGSRTQPVWNDLRGSWTDLVRAFVIEYDNVPPTPSPSLIYTEDFEAGVGPEWSFKTISRSPLGARGFLGRFGNQAVTLILTNLPPHTNLVVAFDLLVVASWDGNTSPGPDVWQLEKGDDGSLLLHTTFSNQRLSARHQAFPDNHPAGRHFAYTGATEIDTLGYGSGNAVYPLRFVFPHSEPTLTLNFRGIGLQSLNDESWGIDNVRIHTGNPPHVVLTSPSAESGFTVGSDVHISAIIEDPDDDVVQVNFLANGQLLGSATEPPYRFSWKDVPSGFIPIVVRAIDSRGLMGTATANVTVNGLKGEYFDATNLTVPRATRLDSSIDFNWADRTPLPSGLGDIYYSVRWTGYIEPEFSQDYELGIRVDDGGRLWVDGRRVIDAWRGQSPTTYTAIVPLERGRRHFIQMEYNNTGCCGAVARLRWQSPGLDLEAIPQRRLFPPDEGETRPPNTPVIFDPRQEDQWVDPRHLAVVADFFSHPTTGRAHTASDWEIWTINSPERVWSAYEVTGDRRLRIRLTEGTFEGSQLGRQRLMGGLSYRLRTRHRDDSGDPMSSWSDWGTRTFQTLPEDDLTASGEVEVTVPGWANPWLAGMPDGTVANDGDTAPDQSPVLAEGVPLEPGSVLVFRAVGATRHVTTQADTGPNGGTNQIHLGGSEHGLSTVNAPRYALMGVFLGSEPPNASPAPSGMDFSTAASRNERTLSPVLKQVFFIGDGRTGAALLREIIVPSGASRLYLGTMDGHGWRNTLGEISVVISTAAWLRSDNLLGNSGLETPGFQTAPGYRYFDHGDQRMDLWAVIDDGFGERPYWNRISHRPNQVYEGEFSVVLNQGSALWTTIPVVGGANYELSFSLMAVFDPRLRLSPFEVTVGQQQFFFEPTATWTRRTMRFTAGTSDPQLRLEFRNPSPTPDYRAYTLDAIALVPVQPAMAPPRMLNMVTPGLLTMEGSPGHLHRIEFTDDIYAPEGWQLLNELVLPHSPHVFADPEAGEVPSRFYRVVRMH